MRAVAVTPGKPNSVHLTELPKPSVNDIPDGKGILVKVLKVGVDATDHPPGVSVIAVSTMPPQEDLIFSVTDSQSTPRDPQSPGFLARIFSAHSRASAVRPCAARNVA